MSLINKIFNKNRSNLTIKHEEARKKPFFISNVPIEDSCTQTSKTIMHLAKLEEGLMTPDSLSPRNSIFYTKSESSLIQEPDTSLRTSFLLLSSPLKGKNVECVLRSKSFMSPTISSNRKRQESLQKNKDSNFNTFGISTINRLKSSQWDTSLKALQEIVESCKKVPLELIYPYMPLINQRLITLLKSSRSLVAKDACQASGQLFELVKDTRKPEFDEIVETLLLKTANSNKFLRQNAFLALEKMVQNIITCNSIRILTEKGAFNQNYLVRSTCARLMVLVLEEDHILSDLTRRRIVASMLKFLEDKNLEIRKLGRKLYKKLSKKTEFEGCLNKLDLERHNFLMNLPEN